MSLRTRINSTLDAAGTTAATMTSHARWMTAALVAVCLASIVAVLVGVSALAAVRA